MTRVLAIIAAGRDGGDAVAAGGGGSGGVSEGGARDGGKGTAAVRRDGEDDQEMPDGYLEVQSVFFHLSVGFRPQASLPQFTCCV